MLSRPDAIDTAFNVATDLIAWSAQTATRHRYPCFGSCRSGCADDSESGRAVEQAHPMPRWGIRDRPHDVYGRSAYNYQSAGYAKMV